MRFAWPDGRQVAMSISFDDARPSNPDNGFGLLDRYGVKATWYVLPEQLNQRLDAWKQAAATGHEIGNHTVTHPCTGNFAWVRQNGNALEEYTLERMEAELLDANEQIHKKLGVRPRTFAYPCGDTFVGRGELLQSYVPVVAKHFLAGRGFPGQCPVDPVTCDLAQLRAYDIDGAGIERIQSLIDAARDENGWVILVGHDIGRPGPQSVQLDVLEQLCRYMVDPANGVWLDTVVNVADFVAKSRSASAI